MVRGRRDEKRRGRRDEKRRGRRDEKRRGRRVVVIKESGGGKEGSEGDGRV